jgi:hypothetical protein
MYTPPEQTPITVAYRKKTGTKVWIKTFKDLKSPDRLITNRSNLLPKGSDILEIGVGSNFVKKNESQQDSQSLNICFFMN